MKSSLSLQQVGRAIAHFFHRYHVILYVLTVVIGVSLAVFLLNSLVAKSNTAELQSAASAGFDRETIKRIDGFDAAKTGVDDFSLPQGRVNPFVE